MPVTKPLALKWVFAYKTNPDGSVIVGKEKARLVAQGFRQCPEDFGETAAPVAKLASIRVLLAWASVQDLEIFQFDCKTAFLHARLKHDVYCRPVSGWPMQDPKNVLKILAALYGLRQSAYEFYMLFFSLLSDLGMLRCECDHGVFFGLWTTPPDPSISMPSDGSPLTLFVPIHVDDGLGITNSAPLYKWFLHSLAERLHIVDLGCCAKFLSIVIVRDRPHRRLWLSSHVYVAELLSDWNLSSCRPASTPLPCSGIPQVAPPNAIPDISDTDLLPKYQCLVGCLLYLAVSTRPDIAYASMWLGQFSSNPTRSHFLAAKHVLQYLAGSRLLALEYSATQPSTPDSLRGFMHNLGCSDADWASDPGDRWSISGYCFFFQGSLVSWSAVKQRAIALSSTEAEYYALTHAFKEALWLRVFLSSLHLPFHFLFLYSVTIKQQFPFLLLLPFRVALNTSISDFILFAHMFPTGLFLQLGYPLPTCLPIFSLNPCLHPLSLITVTYSALSLFLLLRFLSFLASSCGGVLDYIHSRMRRVIS